MNYSVLLNDLKKSVINEVQYRDEFKKNEVVSKLRLYIKKCFGDNSEYLTTLDEIQFNCWNICDENMQRNAWQNAIHALTNLITLIIEDLSLSGKIKIEYNSFDNSLPIINNKIFIIHGHDGELKQEVARFIEKIGLQAVILHEQSDNGETIIERIEGCSDVGFAIALLSPDDEVISGNMNGETKRTYRARQNVIFEMGFFIGRIGRSRLFTIIKGDNIEMLSDFSGVVYHKYSGESWKIKLMKVLKRIGYKIDANDVL